MKLDVICRCTGGKVCIVFCADMLGHVFEWSDGSGIVSLPACGKRVSPVRAGEDDEEVCESCATAAESWAMGGAFRVTQT